MVYYSDRREGGVNVVVTGRALPSAPSSAARTDTSRGIPDTRHATTDVTNDETVLDMRLLGTLRTTVIDAMLGGATADRALVDVELALLIRTIRDVLTAAPLVPDEGSITHNGREEGVVTTGLEDAP